MRFCGVSAPVAAAPSGVVTFFTDVEGSTRRWKADADAIRVARDGQFLSGHPSFRRDS